MSRYITPLQTPQHLHKGHCILQSPGINKIHFICKLKGGNFKTKSILGTSSEAYFIP